MALSSRGGDPLPAGHPTEQGQADVCSRPTCPENCTLEVCGCWVVVDVFGNALIIGVMVYFLADFSFVMGGCG